MTSTDVFNEKYTLQYHLKYFKMMADKFADYTEKCTLKFIDFYKNMQKDMYSLRVISPSLEHAVLKP